MTTTVTKRVSEAMLWNVFSQFIRMRDANANGMATCFTCGRQRHWKQMDCGHGIGRQHQATKYNECNNHAQCKKCNGFEGGQQEIYARRVDSLYGAGTWNRLLVASRATCKRTASDRVIMYNYYSEEVKKLKALKHL